MGAKRRGHQRAVRRAVHTGSDADHSEHGDDNNDIIIFMKRSFPGTALGYLSLPYIGRSYFSHVRERYYAEWVLPGRISEDFGARS